MYFRKQLQTVNAVTCNFKPIEKDKYRDKDVSEQNYVHKTMLQPSAS